MLLMTAALPYLQPQPAWAQLALAVGLSLCLPMAGAQACTVKSVPTASLSVPIEGRAVQAFSCKDADGEQIYVEARAPGGVVAGKPQATALSFYKFTLGQGGNPIKRWQARDFVPFEGRHARAARAAKFVVRDVDGDGLAEAFISYALPGQSANPDDGKLLVFYRDRKFAIRGAVATASGDLSTRTLDPTFTTLPASIQNYALGLWDTVALPRGFMPQGGMTVTQGPEH